MQSEKLPLVCNMHGRPSEKREQEEWKRRVEDSTVLLRSYQIMD